MLRLGIIGTNWITQQFISAAHETRQYQLTSVYSRRFQSAETFAKDYEEVAIYTDLPTFFASKDMDVVYIASPNALHYEQSKQALQAGKHVIVEKPAVSTLKEWEDLLALAKEKQCFIFEAARNIHEANFQQVKELLPTPDKIEGATLSFMKYSSRYDLVKAGEVPNIFSPKFSGGALMDLGIYVVYAAVALFGKPTQVQYTARKIKTEVDGMGTLIFHYPDFQVTLLTGKIIDSFLPSEIYLADGTIILDAINSIESIRYFDRKTQEVNVIDVEKEENPMVEEAMDFANVMLQPTKGLYQKQYLYWQDLGRIVHKIMEQMRLENDIIFPADKKI